MRILISGICGFVGFEIASYFKSLSQDHQIEGIDNFSRVGSYLNRAKLAALSIPVTHADIRLPSDLFFRESFDVIIDASANASVLSGLAPDSNSAQLMQTNLLGTIHLLELAKQWKSTFVFLSTNRVYSIHALKKIPLHKTTSGFIPDFQNLNLDHISRSGLSEGFSTDSPLSLYGATKRASEILVLEYSNSFGFPAWINRCGVLAGAGQFGKPDQGIVAFWLHSIFQRRAMKYIGYGGQGDQVRDIMHPSDLARAIQLQLENKNSFSSSPIFNLAGGMNNAVSLSEMTTWSQNRWGITGKITSDLNERIFDVPWSVLDTRRFESYFDWKTSRSKEMIFDEIARFAENNPQWIEQCE